MFPNTLNALASFLVTRVVVGLNQGNISIETCPKSTNCSF